ncbi:MAG: hypothetical protein QW076_04020, partial [Candidatus Anstonellales archaeon]
MQNQLNSRNLESNQIGKKSFNNQKPLQEKKQKRIPYPIYDTPLSVISDFFAINIPALIKFLLTNTERAIVYDWGFGNGRALKELEILFYEEIINKKLLIYGCSLEYPSFELLSSNNLYVGDITKNHHRIPENLNLIFSYSSIHHIIYSNYSKTCHLGGLNLTYHLNELIQRRNKEFFLLMFTFPIPHFIPIGIEHDSLVNSFVNLSLRNNLNLYAIFTYPEKIDYYPKLVAQYSLIFSSLTLDNVF